MKPYIIILSMFVALIFYIHKEPPDRLFDVNEKSTYQIVKHEGSPYYWLKGKNSKESFEIIIGKSTLDLDKYIGKNIDVRGKFNTRDHISFFDIEDISLSE